MELEARHVVAVFKAFGDENRIRVLQMLCSGLKSFMWMHSELMQWHLCSISTMEEKPENGYLTNTVEMAILRQWNFSVM